MRDDFAYDAFDLQPRTKVHVRSMAHSLFGFNWWSSRVVTYLGMDVNGRSFYSRDVETSERQALAWAKRRYGKQDTSRVREYDVDQ